MHTGPTAHGFIRNGRIPEGGDRAQDPKMFIFVFKAQQLLPIVTILASPVAVIINYKSILRFVWVALCMSYAGLCTKGIFKP